jgi:integrase
LQTYFRLVPGHVSRREVQPEPHLKDFALFAYLTAWRRGEIQTLGWSDVDRDAGRITLRREHSKTAEPRTLILNGELAELIERRWAARMVPQADGNTVLCPLVFHRAGVPVRDFRKAWAVACEAAGFNELLFHDLRRSAIRNMEKAGVSQSVAMKISGHRTTAVYRRYRIVDEADIAEALARTQAAVNQLGRRTVTRLQAAKE